LPPVRKDASIEDDDEYNISTFPNLGVHTLTHVDAFKHFAPAGGPHDKRPPGTADDMADMPLEIFNGLVFVVDVPRDVRVLTREVLQKLDIPLTAERVIFKTANTDKRILFTREFDSSYVALDASGAQWAVEHPSLKLVGMSSSRNPLPALVAVP